jgi:tetratricopeptide (TPR) repeat protein
VRRAPGAAEPLAARAWVRALAGEDLAAALADCDAAIARNPQLPETYDTRALIRLRRGETAQAVADYQAALKLRPDMASALFGRGLAERRLGNAARADADLTRAAALDPKIAENFAKYGVGP